MAGLSILKHMHNLSDEDLVENVGERVLDIAGRQASRVKFDRQPLKFARAPRKRSPYAGDERLGRVADLRR